MMFNKFAFAAIAVALPSTFANDGINTAAIGSCIMQFTTFEYPTETSQVYYHGGEKIAEADVQQGDLIIFSNEIYDRLKDAEGATMIGTSTGTAFYLDDEGSVHVSQSYDLADGVVYMVGSATAPDFGESLIVTGGTEKYFAARGTAAPQKTDSTDPVFVNLITILTC